MCWYTLVTDLHFEIGETACSAMCAPTEITRRIIFLNKSNEVGFSRESGGLLRLLHFLSFLFWLRPEVCAQSMPNRKSAHLRFAYGITSHAQAQAVMEVAPETFKLALYTPPNLAIMAVDGVHATTGMPYWMTIVAITLGIRTAILPIGLLAARNGARTAAMKPEMDALQAAIKVNKVFYRAGLLIDVFYSCPCMVQAFCFCFFPCQPNLVPGMECECPRPNLFHTHVSGGCFVLLSSFQSCCVLVFINMDPWGVSSGRLTAAATPYRQHGGTTD